MPPLSDEELLQYERQVSIWGEENQARLKDRKVVVLGAGGLGSPALYYLAAAGVGDVRIYDHDVVSLSNLNRQILYGYDCIGKSKSECAKKALRRLNRHIEISSRPTLVDESNFEEVTRDCDLLLDLTDSMPTKELINPLIVRSQVKAIHAALVGMLGFCFFNVAGGPCWNCLFTPAPKSRSTKLSLPYAHYPSFGASAGMLGSLVATLAVRSLLGINDFNDRFYFISHMTDFWKLLVTARGWKSIMTPHFRLLVEHSLASFPNSSKLVDEIRLETNPECRTCGRRL